MLELLLGPIRNEQWTKILWRVAILCAPLGIVVFVVGVIQGAYVGAVLSGVFVFAILFLLTVQFIRIVTRGAYRAPPPDASD